MSRFLVRLLSAIAGTALLAACGIPTQSTAQVAPDRDVPAGLLNGSASTTTTRPQASPTTPVTVCLTQQVGPLRTVLRQLPAGQHLNQIVANLAAAPSPAEEGLGLATAVTAGITANVDRGIGKVTLNADFASASSDDQLKAVSQIVCTLTAQPGIGQVQFELNGTIADVPRGDGSLTSDPVSRDDYPGLMP